MILPVLNVTTDEKMTYFWRFGLYFKYILYATIYTESRMKYGEEYCDKINQSSTVVKHVLQIYLNINVTIIFYSLCIFTCLRVGHMRAASSIGHVVTLKPLTVIEHGNSTIVRKWL